MWNVITGFFKEHRVLLLISFVVLVAACVGYDKVNANFLVLLTTLSVIVGLVRQDRGGLRHDRKIDRLGSTTARIYRKMQKFVKIASENFKAFEEFDEFKEHYDDVSNYAGNSPISLTDNGRKTAKDIGAHDTVSDLLPEVMKLLPKDPSMMDVQEACFNYALKRLRANVDNAVRHKIDQRVYHEKGNYKNTLMVYGILLRDAAFKKLGIDG